MTAAEQTLLPDDATVLQIVGDVFVGLFGEESGRPYPDALTQPLPVRADVTVSGQWCGEVEVACSAPLIRRAAAQLLAMADSAVGDDDVRDVIGEFANVIGGNVKSVMPGPSTLSLPTTSVDRQDAPVEQPTATCLDLVWAGEALRVTVSALPVPRTTKGATS